MRNFFKSCKSSLWDRAGLQQAGAQSVRVFLIPNKAPLVSGFLKGSRRTCIPPRCQWGRQLLSALFLPTCYIYSFFSKKWHLECVFLEGAWNPFLRLSTGFSHTSASQGPLLPAQGSGQFPRVPCSNRSLEFSSWYLLSCYPKLPVTPAQIHTYTYII